MNQWTNWGSCASLGIGGMIAAIVMYWKRLDDLRWQEQQKSWMDESRDLSKMLITVFEANATSMAALRDVCQNSASTDDLERCLGNAIDALNRMSTSPTDTGQRSALHDN